MLHPVNVFGKINATENIGTADRSNMILILWKIFSYELSAKIKIFRKVHLSRIPINLILTITTDRGRHKVILEVTRVFYPLLSAFYSLVVTFTEFNNISPSLSCLVCLFFVAFNFQVHNLTIFMIALYIFCKMCTQQLPT
jgi:hypothetical protein